MPEPPRCPKCGAILLPNATGGQCHHCLLSVAGDWPDEENAPNATSQKEAPTQLIHYFGDYELLEAIGHGGMGKVYKARQVSLNRTVAVKMIHAGRFAGPDEVARFRREAESAASLSHENIVPIYEVGEHEGQHYFCMKLIEGGTLADRLRFASGENAADSSAMSGNGGSRDFTDAARLLSKIARAVHHAHQRGIIHRDLKPANILLDRDGEPHLTDFGLARILEGSSHLTGTGGILGTPGYMAPEQLEGKSKDLSTGVDIYALGCILYEQLTGRTPHQADTPAQALAKLANEEIKSPRNLNRFVDRDLETICLTCLAREPARRYDSAAALADDLGRWLRNEPILARRYTAVERVWKWARREPLKAALVLLFILGPLGYAQFILPWLSRVDSQVLTFDPPEYAVSFNHLPKGDPGRATANFEQRTFSAGKGRFMKLEFVNVPPGLASNLLCRVMGDRMGWLDGAGTGPFHQGDSVFVPAATWRDRNYYIGSVNWSVEALLSNAPNAHIRLTLKK